MRWLTFALFSASILGCSSTDSTNPVGAADASVADVDHPDTSAGPVRDAGPDADGATDAGADGATDAPSEAGPTIHPADVTAAARYPQATLVDPQGVVLTAPKVVTVTFSTMDAALRSHLEQFGDTIATTPWWSTVTDGYCAPATKCIGKGVPGGHVSLTEAPAATYDDVIDESQASTLRTFILDHVASGALPPPTDQTVYMLYFPSTTSFTFEGMPSCSTTGFKAYHSWLDVTPPDAGAPVHTQYAVMPDCGDGADVTNVASHELLEAATDPRPSLHLAFALMDPGWRIIYQGNTELGDVCLGATTTESGFLVQRTFSGVSGAAGHSSCVPTLPGPWFSASTSQQVASLKVGQSTTIDVTGYADAPMGEWTMSADDTSALQGGSPYLALSFDDTAMYAGKTVHLTITLKTAPPVDAIHQGYAGYVVRSHGADGKTVHIWPAAVQGL